MDLSLRPKGQCDTQSHPHSLFKGKLSLASEKPNSPLNTPAQKVALSETWHTDAVRFNVCLLKKTHGWTLNILTSLN